MLKLYIAFGVALVVGVLTLLNGIVHGARIITILYRVVISITVFGFVGYGVGMVITNILRKILQQQMTAQNDSDVESEPTAKQASESEFSPFTSDNFEQISRPKE